MLRAGARLYPVERSLRHGASGSQEVADFPATAAGTALATRKHQEV
jgi:hypothetical protein